MNILNLLRSRDERSYQAYIPTKSGKLIMSVVAGEGLYSSPRKKVKTEEYTKLELAIFNMETNQWASYNEVKPILELIGEGEYYDLGEKSNNKPSCAVFGYIEVEKINKVWEML